VDDTNLISGLSKTRIEALTDGIFAIAMTLMVFDIKVPALTQMNQLNLRHELIQRCVFFPVCSSLLMKCPANYSGHDGRK
jgi:uncharacterized membrane protein